MTSFSFHGDDQSFALNYIFLTFCFYVGLIRVAILTWYVKALNVQSLEVIVWTCLQFKDKTGCKFKTKKKHTNYLTSL